MPSQKVSEEQRTAVIALEVTPEEFKKALQAALSPLLSVITAKAFFTMMPWKWLSPRLMRKPWKNTASPPFRIPVSM